MENSLAAFMAEALAEAELAAVAGEVPVGAVIVQNGSVVARGHNEVEGLQDPTAHAEILAIRRAAEKLGRRRLDDCSLFVTLEPCSMCIGAMINARLGWLYFGAEDPKAGAVGSVFDLSQFAELPHQIPATGGLLENECRTVLQKFFANRRE